MAAIAAIPATINIFIRPFARLVIFGKMHERK
jgi:hypothetical protein